MDPLACREWVVTYEIKRGRIGGLLILQEIAGDGGIVDVGCLRGSCKSQRKRRDTGELHGGQAVTGPGKD